MNNLQMRLENLQKSFRNKGRFDNSLLELYELAFKELRTKLTQDKQWEGQMVPKMIDFVKKSFDASSQIYSYFQLKNYNHETGFDVCLRIRMVCVELLQILKSYAYSNKKILSLVLFKTFFKISFQVFAITCRMCLEFNTKYLHFAKLVDDQCKFIYNTINPSDQQPMVFIFILNTLELMKYEIDSKMTVEIVYSKISQLKSLPIPQYQTKYLEYIKWVMMQIAIKLMKRQQNIQKLQQFLPHKQLNILKSIYTDNFDYNEVSNIEGITSNFYELFIQVKRNGFKNIKDDNLISFLQENWNSKGYFEILAENYNDSVHPLYVWFKCHNTYFKKDTSSSYYGSAIKFFISLVHHQQSQNSSIKINTMLQLIEQVASSLVGIKKSAEIPVVPAIKSIIVIFRQFCLIGDLDQKQMTSIFSITKILLVKQQNQILVKDLSGIYLYYLIEKNSPQLQHRYKQYCKSYPEQSQLKNVITIIYNTIKTNEIDQKCINLMNTHPSFCYLIFRSKGIKSLLQGNNDLLNKFQEVFKIFTTILQQQQDFNIVCDRLLSYYPKITIKFNQKVEQQIKELIFNLIQKSKTEITVLQLNKILQCSLFLQLYLQTRKLNAIQKELNYNNFYKPALYLQQLLNIQTSSFIRKLCLSFFSSLIPKILFIKSSEENIVFQEGEFYFYELVYRLLNKDEQQINNKTEIDLIMFQLKLFDRREYQLISQVSKANFEQLNKYLSCVDVPQNVLIEILRKIMYLGVSEEGDNGIYVGIHHLKLAIMCCKDPQQRLTYCKQMVFLFEDEGRQFLEAMALKHEQIKQIFDNQ